MTLATVTAWLASEITAAARDAGFPSEPIVSTRTIDGGGVHVAVEFTLPAEAVAQLVEKLNGRD